MNVQHVIVAGGYKDARVACLFFSETYSLRYHSIHFILSSGAFSLYKSVTFTSNVGFLDRPQMDVVRVSATEKPRPHELHGG